MKFQISWLKEFHLAEAATSLKLYLLLHLHSSLDSKFSSITSLVEIWMIKVSDLSFPHLCWRLGGMNWRIISHDVGNLDWVLTIDLLTLTLSSFWGVIEWLRLGRMIEWSEMSLCHICWLSSCLISRHVSIRVGLLWSEVLVNDLSRSIIFIVWLMKAW